MIQEQANLIEEKEKEGSSDALRAKDKEIMAAAENFEKEVLAHAEIAKRLEESGVLSSRAMKKLSEKQKLIHPIMSKRLEIPEALSTRNVNELSEKEKMILEQAMLIEEK